MSGDAQIALQAALFARLTQALSPAKGYDHVPEPTVFPYWVLGEGSTGPFDTDTEHGQEHTVELHVFTRDRGKLGCKLLQQMAYDALHDQGFSVGVGAALLLIYFEFSSVTLDPDGLTHHGISRFRAVTTEA